MKRIVFSILAALAIFGCQVKEVVDFAPESRTEPEAKVFIAEIEDNNSVATKTSLDNKGNVLWKQGDQVSIFAGSTINDQYQVTDASDGKTSTALTRVTTPGFVAGTEIDHNVAYYPYTSTACIAKDYGSYVISDIVLPAIQHYAEGSFGNGAFPMTAVTGSTDDLRLIFKNVLGGLKLQLTGTAKIASISVTGNNNEILCGAAEVTVANGSVPSITLTDATAKTVTLDCGGGVWLNTETATLFVIALPPVTMEGGFTVTVTDTEGGQMEIKTTNRQTINRSRMLTMPAVTYNEAEEGYVAVSGVYLNQVSSWLLEGETMTLTPTIYPSDATNKEVTWSSSNTSVATVSASGVVTAISAGTATITVCTCDGNKTASRTITVYADNGSVISVGLDKHDLFLWNGDTETLTATVYPENAINKNVIWSSSNPSIASVSSDGVVTAGNQWGSTRITVQTEDGNKTDVCYVEVEVRPHED